MVCSSHRLLPKMVFLALPLMVFLVLAVSLQAGVAFADQQQQRPENQQHPVDHLMPSRQAAQFSWLDNPGAAMNLQQVINRDRHQAFERLTQPLGRGYTLSNSWLSLRLSAAQLAHYDYLWLAPSQLNEVDIYYQVGADSANASHYKMRSLGDHTLAIEKPFLHFRMLFPLDLIAPVLRKNELRKKEAQKPEDDFAESSDSVEYAEDGVEKKYQIYIRIRTNSTHALNAELKTNAAMINDSNLYMFFYAGFVTIAFTLAVFSLFVAFRLKDKVYFWYSVYLFSIMAAGLPITGVFFVLFTNAPTFISDFFSGAGTGFGFFSFSILCSHLLLLADNGRSPLKLYLQFTATVGLIQALVSVFDVYIYISMLAGVNAVVFSLVMLVCFAKRVPAGPVADRFIFSALFITSTGILINFLRLMGWIPENVYTVHAFQIASVLHMLLLNQAFAERVLNAEQKALRSAQRSEEKARELALGMTHDMHQALDSEMTLRQEQERFIDMISHEYRTPLSILKTNLEILELKERPDWTGRHNLYVMQQAAGRLQEVFDKSIQGADWKLGTEAPHEEIELVSLFNHIMDEACLMWNKGNLNYDVHVTHAWYKVLDVGLLKTVVFNLVDNAYKYSSDLNDIQVSLTVSSDQRALVFKVSNPIVARSGRKGRELLQKYIRGGNSVGTSGLGMGLSLVEQIIGRLNDQFDVAEENGRFEANVVLQAEAGPKDSIPTL